MAKKQSPHVCSQSLGFGYFLGIIGAAIHFIGQSTGLWSGALGLLKALVWPVFVVLKILSL